MTWKDQLEFAEEWLPVIEQEGRYEVSNLGRVRSLSRITQWRDGRVCKYSGKLINPSLTSSGYLCVTFSSEEKRRYTLSVHKIVAAAFLGPQPPGTEIHHKDRNRLNNAAYNLRYLPMNENRASGEHNPRAKLRLVDVVEIRRLSLEGMSSSALAKQFRVSWHQIRNIITGRCWKEKKDA